MRVTWLCSRKVEGQVSGYFTEKQIESEKERVKNELLDLMHRQSKRNAEYLKKGDLFNFGTMFYYGDSDNRQDKCIRELFRCKDREEFSDSSEDNSCMQDVNDEKFPVKDTEEALDKYIFRCYKTMYMPVTVNVPDDSTDEDIKRTLYGKMSQDYDYGNDPYHMRGETIPVPDGAAWKEELTLADRIERGIVDISRLYMYEYEWLKYFKKKIFGRYYNDEYELDWESMRHISSPELEDSESDREEIDDYWYERSDLDGSEDESQG